MAETDWVYLDGAFLPASEARVSPFDRGFLFAQSVYEVTSVYAGKLVDFGPHMARLKRSLAGLEIVAPEVDFAAIHEDLIAKNKLEEGLIYLQVTAGEHGPRDFYGPETLTPSVFLFASHRKLIGEAARDGITAISLEDTRWKRRDYKTTQLVSQSLAYRAARRAGAVTAIMHEDGMITEAASANLWIVSEDGALITRNLSSALLPGITRERVQALVGDLSVEERPFSLDELFSAREAFTSSTGAMIAPLFEVDGKPIAHGIPGPVTRRIQAAYYEFIGADLSAIDWL
ncbi:MAG: aminotransferase class IV [Pseudomonadota bacterium]